MGQPEEFNAVAIVNNNLGSGAGRVIMRVDRWSTEAERTRLTAALQKGSDALLDVLRDQRSVGTIRTPDSLGYDLRYAHQEPGEDGGRRIVIATDRPIGFWEARNQPRSIDYPFTVIQMEIGKDGEGQGDVVFRDESHAARQRDHPRKLRDVSGDVDEDRGADGSGTSAVAEQLVVRAGALAIDLFGEWRPAAPAFLRRTPAPLRLRR